ncbi:MAG: alpha/beta fold hydrolase, partial [Hyphomicrobiaceae bacterium]
LNHLALLYQDMGRNEEAQAYAARALEIREKTFGPNHPDVAITTHALGRIAELLGNSKSAEQLYLKAIRIQEQVIGGDHPHLAATLADLGSLYKSMGRLDDAKPLLERSLAIREKGLTATHPALASGLIQLGELYRLLGRSNEADILFRRARTIRRSEYKEVPVYFATDRVRDDRAKTIAFGTKFGIGKLKQGLAKVVILEEPMVSAATRSAASNKGISVDEVTELRHLAVTSLQVTTEQQVMDNARQQSIAAQAFKGQALLFVHGYNVSFENSVRRAGQIAFDLGFDGPAFVFSWASSQSLFGYFTDRESVEIAAEHLRGFLSTMMQQGGIKRIHLAAHSMGNMVLLRTLSNLSASSVPVSSIGQIISAAPDVNPDLFAQFAKRIQSAGGKITVYASGADKALWFSQWLWHRPRVGFVSQSGPSLIPGVDTIDITNAGTSLFAVNHDNYASSPIVVSDIRKALAGIRPPDRRTVAFVAKPSPKGEYWIYQP